MRGKLPIPIISNGHGGMIAGEYQTAGKRSPIWSDGTVLYEGEFNRAIKSRVIELLNLAQIPYIDLVEEAEDIPRHTRVMWANDWHNKKYLNTFLIDVHANAAAVFLKGRAKGSEVFISRKASKNSHVLANFCQGLYHAHFPSESWRGIKKRNFDMVHLTRMPAVLLECFFMDNERECKTYLMSKDGRSRIAQWIFDVIVSYRKYHEK